MSRFLVEQRITPFQNTYAVRLEDGQLIAFAKQKRMAFKESFSLYDDETATRVVLRIDADRAIDVRSVLTVRDEVGGLVGRLRKRGAASLVRSTWELQQPGLPLVVVQERSLVVALLRRLWDFVPFAGAVPVPWVFHFDGTDPSGRTVLTHSRRWGLRDRYVLEVLAEEYDARLAIALAVVLDALQSR